MKAFVIAVIAAAASLGVARAMVVPDKPPVDLEFCGKALEVNALPTDQRIPARSTLVKTRAWQLQVDVVVVDAEFQRCVGK